MSKKPAKPAFDEDKTLWAKLQAELVLQEEQNTNAGDTTVVFCGRKRAGKTSAIDRFIADKDPSHCPKPTVALDYTYTRAQADGGPKVVANLFEVGSDDVGPGGAASEMLAVPITAESVLRTVAVVCLSLEEPGNALKTLHGWLQVLEARCAKCLEDIKAEGDGGIRKVGEYLDARRAALAEHADAQSGSLAPFPVQLVLLLTKSDALDAEDTTKRKWLARALRYFAHVRGAHVIGISTKHKASLTTMKTAFRHLFFNLAPKKPLAAQKDHLQPLYVAAGEDSLESIGPADGGPASEGAWARLADSCFPAPAAQTTKKEEEEDAKYAERDVDAMVHQKAEELAAYRRQAERAQRLASGGVSKAAAASAMELNAA